jgi:hypothetical protein
MTGVEILATSEIAVGTSFSITAALGAFGITFGLFILGGLFASLLSNDWGNMGFGILFGILIGLFFGVGVGFGEGMLTKYETHYKVIISDEVSMNEFLERYEIMDQEGKIYTVRERDGETE